MSDYAKAKASHRYAGLKALSVYQGVFSVKHYLIDGVEFNFPPETYTGPVTEVFWNGWTGTGFVKNGLFQGDVFLTSQTGNCMQRLSYKNGRSECEPVLYVSCQYVANKVKRLRTK